MITEKTETKLINFLKQGQYVLHAAVSFPSMYKIISKQRYKTNKEVTIDQKGTTTTED